MALRTDRLRELREKRGWSMRELARRCGFGATQIRKYEMGEADPASAFLAIIADQLDVAADYLLGRTDDMKGTYGTNQLSESEQAVLDTYRREGWIGLLKMSTAHLVEKSG